MQVNKNGIPISTKQARKELLNKLDMRDLMEFSGVEQGCEITIVIPNFEPVVRAVKDDGWRFVKSTKGEMV